MRVQEGLTLAFSSKVADGNIAEAQVARKLTFRRPRWLVSGLVAALMITLTATVAAPSTANAEGGPIYGYRELRIAYPDAQSTTVYSRNDKGEVVGTYVDQAGAGKGFAYLGRPRAYISIEPAGAIDTVPRDINNHGDVVGYYSDSAGTHGFLYRGGVLTTVDLPGDGTILLGLSNAGDMVGSLHELADDGTTLRDRAFVIWSDGEITFIVPPAGTGVQPTDVNARGQVVGLFLDVFGTAHGFQWEAGTLAILDVPGNAGLTQANGINDRGEIVGVYVLAEGYRGFRYADGQYTTVHYRRGTGNGSTAGKIDDRGWIVGEYYPAEGNAGFFVASPDENDRGED